MYLECGLPEGGTFSGLLTGSDTGAVMCPCMSVALWINSSQQMVLTEYS